MKKRIIVSILGLVLGISTSAYARHFGRATGIVGTVTAVARKTFTVSVSSAGATRAYIVRFTRGTKVIGRAAHGINASLIGHSVSVVGAGSRGTVRASEVVVGN